MGLPKSSGSKWRKWDLHLHAPETKKSDSYTFPGGNIWNEYCRILHESDVHAFGITDYFSADGYFKTRDEYRKRYPDCKKRFFPNIELCLNVVVNKDHDYINIHVIFNPQIPDDRLRAFLARLKTTISRNGSPLFASELSSTSDYDQATTTKENIEVAIADTFGVGERLNHLLIIPAVNNDGIRPKSGVARRKATSIELEKISDAFFGNGKDTLHYLETDRWSDTENSPARAVLSGCDAHSFSDLRECLGKTVYRDGKIHKQETWVKADVTYEGLKQIVFEPEGRVVVGYEPLLHDRLKAAPRRYIRSLSIDKVPEYDGQFGVWFEGEDIELNPELVAIVGNKGSGKSAVTDILGLVGNSHKQMTRSEKPEELFSFLTKEKFLKQNCAANFSAQLHWYAGQPNDALLNTRTDANRPEEVEYLPQRYLEKICANIDDSEFRGKLNEVIFGYVKPNETYGKGNLDDLVEYRTNQANEDIRMAVGVLHEHNNDVVHIERKMTLAYATDIDGRIQTAETTLSAHIANPISPVSQPAQDDPTAAATVAEIARIEREIDVLRQSRVAVAEEQARLTRISEDLQQAKHAIERPITELRLLKERFKSLFDEAGIEFDRIVSIALDTSTLDGVVETAEARVEEIAPSLATLGDLELEQLVSDVNVLEKARKESIDWNLRALEGERVALIDGLNKPSREYQTYLLAEQAWQTRRLEIEGSDVDPAEQTLNWLRQEKVRISQTYPSALTAAREARNAASKKIFELKKNLLTFYDVIKEDIDKEIKSHGKELGGYDISIDSDLKLRSEFSEGFFRFITQQRKGSFYGAQEGKLVLAQIADTVPDWRIEESVFAALDNVLHHIDFDARLSERDSSGERPRRDVFDQMKQGRDPIEFYDFLFGLSYLDPVYDLKVDGKTLTELSPGERGGVLLVFYLMLDKRDIPLVIDQPEDNLDNKSVYEILVKFLKQAKRRRQIIIATHNPNLAVVADAEQIINVRIDKTGLSSHKNDFEFASGAIEDLQINRIVVDILEGTPPAFDNRRLKYRR